MGSHILSLGTAVPDFEMVQELTAEVMVELFALKGSIAKKLRELYKNSAIHKRYSVISEFYQTLAERKIWGSSFLQSPPKATQVNEIYMEEAPKLAIKAGKKALEKGQIFPNEITHVISVSCTGVMAPGLEAHLIKALELNPQVERYGVNFMGCFGAFKGLGLANALAALDPKNRVLVVCTELCSLHIQPKLTMEAMVSNAIFADGSAAVVVGQYDPRQPTPLFEMVKSASQAVPNTIDKMTWELGDHGFIMGLSKDVPTILMKEMDAFVKRFGLDEEPDWAIHPGGKAILENIQTALSITSEDTFASWEVLKNHGNMSSATFLFVLEKLLTKPKRKKFCLGMGMGPGLLVEGMLLKQFAS